MINYIYWTLKLYWSQYFIISKNGVGIQTSYLWKHKLDQENEFFLHNFIDDNNKTIWYLAFDHIDQKLLFEKLHKINGVGIKSAYHISFCDIKQLDKAINDVDVNFFGKIQWIWPKTAKKILVELKLDIWKDEISRLNIDKKILNQVVKYFSSLWYNEVQVKTILWKYNENISDENIWDVYKYIIDNISKK